jgi:hypothetical protein
MAKLDLRKDQKTAPSAAETESVFQGKPPLEAGKPINLPDDVKTFFEKAGWKDGDPVPNLTSVVEEIQKDQSNVLDDMTNADETHVQPGQVLDFDQLSPEHQERLTKAVADAKEQYDRIEEQSKQILSEPGGEGINAAIQLAADEEEGDIEVVVDDDVEEDGVLPDDPVEGEDLRGSDKSGAFNPMCPNCGWDTTDKEVLEVSDKDKYGFMTSILGETRFYKKVEFFGGSVSVQYRTLTTREADLALTQCSYDYRDGKIDNQADFFRQHADYRLCMSIDKIFMQERVHAVPPVDEIEWDDPQVPNKPQTALPSLLEYVNTEIFKSESIRRVVGQTHYKIQRLVEKMEGNVNNSDFWRGIDSPV